MDTTKTNKETKQKITSVGEDAKKLELSCTTGRNAKWYRHCGKQYKGSSKNYK